MFIVRRNHSLLTHALAASLSLVAVLIASAPAAAQPNSAGRGFITAQDSAAVVAALDTMAAGWNRGDLAGYMSGYAPSIETRGGDGFISGRAAVEQNLRNGYWKAGKPEQTLNVRRLSVHGLSPTVAIATGQYVLSGNGQPEHTGWFTTVWTRTSTGWHCVHDHSSAS